MSEPPIPKPKIRCRLGELSDVAMLESQMKAAYGPGYFDRQAFEARLKAYRQGFHVVEIENNHDALGFMSLWPVTKATFAAIVNLKLSDVLVTAKHLCVPKQLVSKCRHWICLSYHLLTVDEEVADTLVHKALTSVNENVVEGPINIIIPCDHPADKGLIERLGKRLPRDTLTMPNGTKIAVFQSLANKSDLKQIIGDLATRLEGKPTGPVP